MHEPALCTKLAVVWLQALLAPLESFSAMVVQQHSINVGVKCVQQMAHFAAMQRTYAVQVVMAASA